MVALVAPGCREAQMAAILQLSQYCTFTRDSISTVITEPGQPGSHWPLHGTAESSVSSSLSVPKTPPHPAGESLRSFNTQVALQLRFTPDNYPHN